MKNVHIPNGVILLAKVLFWLFFIGSLLLLVDGDYTSVVFNIPTFIVLYYATGWDSTNK